MQFVQKMRSCGKPSGPSCRSARWVARRRPLKQVDDLLEKGFPKQFRCSPLPKALSNVWLPTSCCVCLMLWQGFFAYKHRKRYVSSCLTQGLHAGRLYWGIVQCVALIDYFCIIFSNSCLHSLLLFWQKVWKTNSYQCWEENCLSSAFSADL